MVTQRGNALFLILIAVALFAALAYAVTQSGRSGSGSGREQELLEISKLVQYAGLLQSTVSRMRLTGCNDADFSFENPVEGGYANAAAPADGSCNVFSGGLSWEDNFGSISNFTPLITGNAQVRLVGTISPVFQGPTGSELVFALQVNSRETCMRINDGVNVDNYIDDVQYGTNPPHDAAELIEQPKFDGAYSADITIDGDGPPNPLEAKGTACYVHNRAGVDEYYFFQVLLER